MLKNIALSLALVTSAGAVGCTQTETTTTTAIAGGAIGAAVAGRGDRVEGALIGAAAGAAAGLLIGRAQNNECYYADGRGGYYKQRCR